MSTAPPAVWVRGLRKTYGSRSNKDNVIQSVNMTAQAGSMRNSVTIAIAITADADKYCLIGPSGCGKTTLLRCLIGRLDYDQGEVIVLGDRPGAPGHGVPGNMVGYMPQEIALYEEFNISDILFYFGRIHGMTKHNIQTRLNFLMDIFSLTTQNKLIKELSDGQKRRVSFCVALLQEPDLLVLDEPTVGVDPVLRARIWEHLLQISQSSRQTTIIITTHYIEEARQAHKVGLMRNGYLLAEDSPQNLMDSCQESSLENTFTRLCLLDQRTSDTDHVTSVYNRSCVGRDTSSNGDSGDYGMFAKKEVDMCNNLCSFDEVEGHPTTWLVKRKGQSLNLMTSATRFLSKGFTSPEFRRFLAILLKNLTMMRRRPGFLLFLCFLPVLKIALYCTFVGRELHNLDVAIVNSDRGPLGAMFTQYLDEYAINKITQLTVPMQGRYWADAFSIGTVSARHRPSKLCYLGHVCLFMQIYCRNISSALDMVRQGRAWGAVEMRKRFSRAIAKRYALKQVDEEIIANSNIHVHLDMTHYLISVNIKIRIMNAFESFASEMASKTYQDKALTQIPIEFEPPVYGAVKPKFGNFIAPAIILSITFYLATGLTELSIIGEKMEGLLDRSRVAGVRMIEVLGAHICTQLLCMVVQVALILVFVLAVFKVPNEGPVIWIVLLTFLQGVCGMAFGLVISVICDDTKTAAYIALGSLYPLLLISGIVWPIEGLPTWLRYISCSLPLTYPGEAMRAIFGRGWDITYMVVWRGYLTAIGWSLALMLVAIVVVRVRQ